jgi:hypothetical protein
VPKHLRTVRDVIAALGGTSRVAELTGTRYTAAHNWHGDGFPARTYVVLMRELEARGLTADPELWGMTTGGR